MISERDGRRPLVVAGRPSGQVVTQLADMIYRVDLKGERGYAEANH
jgi:hypothetical protein